MKKLYELEYEVAELRKKYLNYIDTDKITLKEVLELGFNNVIINNIRLYADEENDIVIYNGNYLRNDIILNANVKYLYNEIIEDNLGDYLEVYCEFVDNKYKEMLENFIKELESEEK